MRELATLAAGESTALAQRRGRQCAMALNDDLLAALGLGDVVPAALAQWRPLVIDGVQYFLERLPAHRQATIWAKQLTLPPDVPAAVRLVTLLSECPTLHKLGQVLARNRQLHPELRRQLQTLESLTPVTPIAAIRARITRDCALAPSVELARDALAEGSVAVVLPFTYRVRGETRHGVFKALKPGVEEKFTEEIAIWLALGEFLEDRSRHLGLPPLDYRGTLESVRNLLSKEIRLDVEQHNLREAAAFYAHEPRILVPHVLPWCTPQLTAMERVFGIKATDAPLSGGQREQLAATMVSALVGQTFWSAREQALVHADLHAGNLLITDDGRLAVLDWSLAVHLSKADREALVALLLAGLALDASRMRAIVAGLGTLHPDDPLLANAVEQALDRLVWWKRLPGFEWLMEMLDEIGGKTATGFSENFVLFRKSWFSLSGIIHELAPASSPDIELLALGVRRFLEELGARAFAAPEARPFSTHVSNADLVRLGFSQGLACIRWWARLLQAGVAGGGGLTVASLVK